jgi:hypothetical protein
MNKIKRGAPKKDGDYIIWIEDKPRLPRKLAGSLVGGTWQDYNDRDNWTGNFKIIKHLYITTK